MDGEIYSQIELGFLGKIVITGFTGSLLITLCAGGRRTEKQAEKRRRKDRFIKQDYPINGRMALWRGRADGWGEWVTSSLSFSIYEAKQWRCLQRGGAVKGGIYYYWGSSP